LRGAAEEQQNFKSIKKIAGPDYTVKNQVIFLNIKKNF